MSIETQTNDQTNVSKKYEKYSQILLLCVAAIIALGIFCGIISFLDIIGNAIGYFAMIFFIPFALLLLTLFCLSIKRNALDNNQYDNKAKDMSKNAPRLFNQYNNFNTPYTTYTPFDENRYAIIHYERRRSCFDYTDPVYYALHSITSPSSSSGYMGYSNYSSYLYHTSHRKNVINNDYYRY